MDSLPKIVSSTSKLCSPEVWGQKIQTTILQELMLSACQQGWDPDWC
jgi:hypothetical protein